MNRRSVTIFPKIKKIFFSDIKSVTGICNLRPIDNMEQQEDIYIKRIQNGETELFSHVVANYSQSVFLLILRIVHNREDAEELTQDVFLKTYRTLNHFKGDSLFSTWLYRIAYNTAISATRKKKQEFLYIEEQTIENVPDEEINNVFGNTLDEERLQALRGVINQLTPDERGIITLFYTEQKTVEDIASVTDLTTVNVKVKLHRIRKKLYVMLKRNQDNSL